MGFRKSTSIDSLASAARQLGYALEESADLDAAFKALYATADERRRVMLQQLEGLLRSRQAGNAESATVRASWFPMLKWVLASSPAPERTIAAVLQEIRRQQLVVASGVAAMWGEFSGFLVYLGAVLAVLILVVTLFTVFMLPQFSSLYSNFGSQLPGLTQFAFGVGAPEFTALLVGSLALLIFLGWFVRTLRNRLRRYEALQGGLRRIPVVGPVVLAHNEYLWLSCAQLLAIAGVAPAQALELSAQRFRSGDAARMHGQSTLASDLAVATQLGKLEAELRFQQDAAVETLLLALARCRRVSRIVLTICTYILVGLFVSAMYLPLFSLGSTI